MGSIYIITLLLCRVVQAFFDKKSSNSVNGIVAVMKYNGFRQCVSAILALILILIGGNGLKFEPMTLVLSAAAGALIILSLSCSLYAMKTGMVALVSLFTTAGMIVPCIAGIFLYGIPVKPMQWVGMAVFFVGAYLMIMGSKQTMGKFSLKTFVLLIGVLLADGFTMVVQQMFKRVVPNGDVSAFSFFAFGIIGIVFTLATPLVSKISGEETKPLTKPMLIYGVILAAALLVMNQTVTTAASLLPPVILFTFANGGGTVVSAIVAAVAYKEKLTVKSVLGIVIGISALLIIKIFE